MPWWFLTMLLCSFGIGTQTKKVADILWNKSDPAFANNTKKIIVRIRDKLNIHCPKPVMPDEKKEIFAIFRVDSKGAYHCESDKNHVAGICRPGEMVTITFRMFSPLPNALEFKENVDYYFITTSTGTEDGLWNTMGGLCKSRGLRLHVHVLPRLAAPSPRTTKRPSLTYDNNELESNGQYKPQFPPVHWEQNDNSNEIPKTGVHNPHWSGWTDAQADRPGKVPTIQPNSPSPQDWIVEYIDTPPDDKPSGVSTTQPLLCLLILLLVITIVRLRLEP